MVRANDIWGWSSPPAERRLSKRLLTNESNSETALLNQEVNYYYYSSSPRKMFKWYKNWCKSGILNNIIYLQSTWFQCTELISDMCIKNILALSKKKFKNFLIY